MIIFDIAINSGPSRAIKFLQDSVETTKDGIIGPQTIKETLDTDEEWLIEDIFIQRQEFYESLDTFDVFGRGWTSRNNKTFKLATEMIV